MVCPFSHLAFYVGGGGGGCNYIVGDFVFYNHTILVFSVMSPMVTS